MFRALILAATIAASARGADAAATPVGSATWGAATVDNFATQPRAPWQADDPADSLYRSAREQLNRGDYRTAAKSFALIVDRFPKSTYAGDALYWQAYAYYSIGEQSQLREALRVLDEQRRRYPKAATRGDADALSVRIKGALARQGDDRSAEDIARVAKGASEPCSRSGNDDDDERMAALNALLQMNAERAVPVLKQVLAKRDACSAGLREKAVFLLSQKRTPETEDIMLDVVKNDPSRDVRKKAVFWLGQVNTDKAADALMQMLTSSTADAEMREQAVFALMQQHSTRGQAAVRAIAEDPKAPDGVREKAVFWLGQQRSPENATFLRGLFDKLAASPEGSANESIAKKILFSLSQMRGEGNDKWLMDVAANSRYSVETRKQAIFGAGQANVTTADLVALYPRLADRELKGQLIWVLSEKRDGAAVDRLMQIAKTDPDREMRKKAIFWLGQSNDPRVKDFLLEIINSPR
ncbi:MAG: HEAT repeat domain-containing protein [Gemmatimonadetes bacterium]|nr:HEAT repeat domain-containing protein [Gemmatimonadota bacterium]